MYRAYAADPADAGQRRHPPPPGAAAAERPAQDRADERPAVLLPGTPVIYYGDELGMGDNVYLGDRDAVRTPDAVEPRPQRRVLARQPAAAVPAGDHRPRVPLRDRQRRGPAAATRSSLLWWMRRIIALRQQHQVFGRGDIEFLLPENAKVLAFIRRARGRGRCWSWPTCRGSPRACTSTCTSTGARSPSSCSAATSSRRSARAATTSPSGPTASTGSRCSRSTTTPRATPPPPRTCRSSASPTTGASCSGAARGPGRAGPGAGPTSSLRNRWYAGRTRTIRHVEVDRRRAGRGRAGPSRPPSSPSCRSSTPTASPRPTSCPLTVAAGAEAERCWPTTRTRRRLARRGQVGRARCCCSTPSSTTTSRRHAPARSGGNRTFDSQRRRRDAHLDHAAILRGSSATATDLSVARHRRSSRATPRSCSATRPCMKIFRRAQEGVNPDLEIGRFLTDARVRAQRPAARRHRVPAGPGRAPHPRRAQQLRPQRGRRLALHARRPRPVLRVGHAPAARRRRSPCPAWAGLLEATDAAVPDLAAEPSGPTSTRPSCSAGAPPSCTRPWPQGDTEAFEPEPFTSLYQRSLYQSMRAQVRPTLSLVRRMLDVVDEDAPPVARARARPRGRAARPRSTPSATTGSTPAASGSTATTTSARCCTPGATS